MLIRVGESKDAVRVHQALWSWEAGKVKVVAMWMDLGCLEVGSENAHSLFPIRR